MRDFHKMQTRRQRITELLEEIEHPLTVTEICQILEIPQRSLVTEDLKHIAKSVQNDGKQLVARTPTCGKCQFEFKGRRSVKKPSRCPKCKSEWILPPSFIIVEQ
ncbi:MAG: transcriptional regulator [Candidatus Lokiarchaeota archaeon]|nr:transcriptional regulator [Candidatus Lokiarchaeota archaeon]